MYKNSPEHKQYFLCDLGYDLVEIDKTLRTYGYEPIILQNKRNLKDPAKIRKLTEEQKRELLLKIHIHDSNSTPK